MTDAAFQLSESATYCRLNDDKRPTTVGLPDFTISSICDADPAMPAPMVTSAYPDGWFVRVMFDELLDPDVEELVEIIDPETGMGTDTYSGTIANTQPVILECESVAGGFIQVSYDGYYSPAGNSVTWPLGPALVIKPDEPRQIATNKMCRVTLKDTITDKSGNPVPADQRGPFEFMIAPITPIFIDPSDDEDGVSPIDALQIYYSNVYAQFNTEPDPTSFCDDGTTMDQCEFAFTPDTGQCTTAVNGIRPPCEVAMAGADCPTAGDTCEAGGSYAYSISGTEFGFGPVLPIQGGKSYTFSFLEGAKVKDRCGVETTFGPPAVADNTLTHFTTNPFTFNAINIGDGDTVSALTKPSIQFNNVIRLASFDAASEFSISPAPANLGYGSSALNDGDILVQGDYQPGTQYTMTFKANATITDFWGEPYTQAADEMVTWTTEEIAVTAISPTDGETSVRATATDPTSVLITFNQSMDPTTLTAADYTMSGGITFAAAAVYDGCTPASTSCTLQLDSTTPLMAGTTYTFTLKAGAQITDVLNNMYTQVADRSVSFDVENAQPAIQCL